MIGRVYIVKFSLDCVHFLFGEWTVLMNLWHSFKNLGTWTCKYIRPSSYRIRPPFLAEVEAKLFRLMNWLCNRFMLLWHFGYWFVFLRPSLPVVTFFRQPRLDVSHISPHDFVIVAVDERVGLAMCRHGGDIPASKLLRVYLYHRLLVVAIVSLVGPNAARLPNGVNVHS